MKSNDYAVVQAPARYWGAYHILREGEEVGDGCGYARPADVARALRALGARQRTYTIYPCTGARPRRIRVR